MSLPRVVATHRIFPETAALLAPHAELDVNLTGEAWSYETVRERCRGAAGLLAFMTDRVDAAFLADCPSLRVVGAALKGYDNIDVTAAADAGVYVTIVPDLLTVPTAELAIGLMLALARHIVEGDRAIRSAGFSGWRPTLYGVGLAGATVGLVGLGKVGCAIAERLVPFGCRLLGHDAMAGPLPPQLAGALTRVDFATVSAEADILVLALPLTGRTCRLLDADAIARMKPGALVVNPARGSLVDERAIADALAYGRLGGYAADVFACEDWSCTGRPSAIEPRLLAARDRTVLTPHIGSAVISVRREIEASAARGIMDVLAGRRPEHAVAVPARERSPC